MIANKKQTAQALLRVGAQQSRTMATEKQISMRITSTKNIAKITKSMKMVSAAKMRGAQNRLDGGRPFAQWLDNFGTPALNVVKDGALPEDRQGKKQIIVPVTSDRGLCGGVNSILFRTLRDEVPQMKGEIDFFVIGERGRSQMRRLFLDKFRASVTECWSSPVNFAQASAMAESILAAGDYDKVQVVYNKFESAIAYSPSIRTVALSGTTEVAEGEQVAGDYLDYEVEPDNRQELMQDLNEFYLASSIFHGMIEGATSEESSRMSAMENATNNAEDLIGSLTVQYNKARQARITTELIEIISGASSLDG